jgi:hypothetical protein
MRHACLTWAVCIVVALMCGWSASAQESTPGRAWRFDPLKNVKKCAQVEPLPECDERYWSWLAAGAVTFGSQMPAHPRTAQSKDLMRTLRSATTCWLEENGFLECALKPCLLSQLFRRGDRLEVRVHLVYQVIAKPYAKKGWWRCEDGHPVLVLPQKVGVGFWVIDGRLEWDGAPHQRVWQKPCTASMLEVFYPPASDLDLPGFCRHTGRGQSPEKR